MGDVTTFGGGAAGFSASGFEVLVRGICSNDGAPEFARDLSEHAAAIQRMQAQIEALRAQNMKLTAENHALRAKVPAVPARILATGTVRFDGRDLWLMSRRETGWGSFGLRVGSWDELFRRFNVAVTEHGTDEHGAWWSVENVKENDR